MNLEFSQPVTDQHFAVICLPRDTERQKCIENKVTVMCRVRDAAGAGSAHNNGPDESGTVLYAERAADVKIRHDGLGNPYAYGLIREEHYTFTLISEGIVETGLAVNEEYEDPASALLWRYRVESPFTAAGQALRGMYERCRTDCDPYTAMLQIGKYVYGALSYVSGSTDVSTTAEQAAQLGHGVCQDYAHVMIALLRMAGIPARYVIGLIPGEGETHAWVEANCRGYWYGIDPTNDVLVDENYIKFAHGRDYGDCMVSRGIFTNPYATQRTRAEAAVHETEQKMQQ